MKRKSKYTKELLTEKASKVFSIGKLLESLGLKQTGGNHRHIAHKLRLFEIDISHFKGKGWSKGETAESNESVARVTKKISFSDAETFIENSPISNGSKLKKRLLKIGWIDECSECKISNIWNGKNLVLQVDHINGIHNDNRLNNLRIMCPNCHSQTNTWAAKNRK